MSPPRRIHRLSMSYSHKWQALHQLFEQVLIPLRDELGISRVEMGGTTRKT